jgi:Flp pilus assembly protein TadG
MMTKDKKRNRENGNAAVETVLVIVPLLMVLLAILDFSVAIFIMNTMEYAARQGVRYAITGNTITTPTALPQCDSIRQVVRDNSLGFLNSAPNSQITITYYALDPATNTWKVTTTNGNGNLVKVAVQGFSWAWMAPGWIGTNSTLSINAASADISSACVNGVCPAMGTCS